ncbi:SIT4 phosphatase-associated protein-domain-containing protein [Collybia nuda]|uniref:SIT4 phosphatase-associated protein-domain-containing protein n=1 Tax=Collybia nuda TaxID=64659 RepID=A0A9P5Y5Q7_9AGAR|nr:SIT4 phosphatase-associated protein-domain-containing protein [Collybia nuda]
MFWKFGFHNASTIDSLLDKDEVALEAILDEDDLLQECKSQNTRLIDYFQRVDVLQRLFGYVTGQIEVEDKGRFKYPYVATEVLCSEIWSIVETCMNEQNQLMVPFWETVMDRSPEDMKTEMIMASHFAKINAVFLNKKPVEMFAFIRSQPSVVERLLLHIETPSFVDLLVRIIQLDENPTGAGVLEWLSAENLMGRLIDLLSPTQTSDIHTIVAELIKGIISMATPSPGAGLTEGLQNGPASNRFARELASTVSIEKLTNYILADFSPSIPTIRSDENDTDSEDDHTSKSQQLPSFETSTSSVVHSVSIIIELIRKNNSDYFEPYLFHTLRNRLIQVQQQLNEDNREALEKAMKEMTDRMGVVHLGPVLEIMCEKLEQLQQFLKKPRSLNGPVSTTIGAIIPLTFERYRICELFAELLHCSNMSLLNRTSEQGRIYDSEGRLQGGLGGLEDLAQVISLDTGDGRDDPMDEGGDETEPALELPVTNHHDSPTLDSDDDMSDEPGSSDDDAMEEIAMYDEPQSLELSPTTADPPLLQPHIVVPSSPNTASLPPPSEIAAQGAALSRGGPLGPGADTDATSRPRSRASSRKSSRRANTLGDAPNTPITVGERLKQRFLDINVLSTLLDLFFAFPWNNFLHSAVYDMVHQILTGYVDTGLNRELAISLFRDARLMHRIVEGQKMNDAEIAKPKGVRLGFMGHLTLMSEDVITALERFPPDLRLIMIEFAPDPEWDQYVTGRYKETKRRDTRVLGGGKPVVAPGSARNITRWKIDEDEGPLEANGSTEGQEGKGEFRRTGGMHPARQSADFGPAPVDEDEDEESSTTPHQFARYLAQEMHSSDVFGSSESDDEDEEGGWLSQSHFSLSAPPVSARHQSTERRPLSLSTPGFDDSFVPQDVAERMAEDPFNSNDDDGFGPFADTATAASGSDPFTFSSSLSEDIEDSSFDSSFGDFGDFQTAQDGGDLTPTTGSWTFASDSGASEEVGEESSRPEKPLSPFSTLFETSKLESGC